MSTSLDALPAALARETAFWNPERAALRLAWRVLPDTARRSLAASRSVPIQSAIYQHVSYGLQPLVASHRCGVRMSYLEYPRRQRDVSVCVSPFSTTEKLPAYDQLLTLWWWIQGDESYFLARARVNNGELTGSEFLRRFGVPKLAKTTKTGRNRADSSLTAE